MNDLRTCQVVILILTIIIQTTIIEIIILITTVGITETIITIIIEIIIISTVVKRSSINQSLVIIPFAIRLRTRHYIRSIIVT